jgi:hypothetical protein
MTTTAPPTIPQTELVSPTLKPQELSFPLPKALHTTGHVHLTFLGHCVMVHLATSTPGDSSGSFKPMGSFVYAMPDVSPPLSLACSSSALSNHSCLCLPVQLCFLSFENSLSALCRLYSRASRSGVYTLFKKVDMSICHSFWALMIYSDRLMLRMERD